MPNSPYALECSSGSAYIGLNKKGDRLKRIYRSTISLKVFYLVFLGLSIFFGIAAWRGISRGANTWLDFAGAVIFVFAGTGFAAQTLTARVVLSDDSIRVGSLFSSQALRFDQIRYRREYTEYHDAPDGGIHVDYLELVPNDSTIRALKIPKDDFDFDRAFWDWMVSIPDLERLRS
jgi:hypothetical protein